jgi:hypothetical protein
VVVVSLSTIILQSHHSIRSAHLLSAPGEGRSSRPEPDRGRVNPVFAAKLVRRRSSVELFENRDDLVLSEAALSHHAISLMGSTLGNSHPADPNPPPQVTPSRRLQSDGLPGSIIWVPSRWHAGDLYRQRFAEPGPTHLGRLLATALRRGNSSFSLGYYSGFRS